LEFLGVKDTAKMPKRNNKIISSHCQGITGMIEMEMKVPKWNFKVTEYANARKVQRIFWFWKVCLYGL